MSQAQIPRQRTRVTRAVDRFRMLQTGCGTLNVQPEESEVQPPDETPGGGGDDGGDGGDGGDETGTQNRALLAGAAVLLAVGLFVVL